MTNITNKMIILSLLGINDKNIKDTVLNELRVLMCLSSWQEDERYYLVKIIVFLLR